MKLYGFRPTLLAAAGGYGGKRLPMPGWRTDTRRGKVSRGLPRAAEVAGQRQPGIGQPAAMGCPRYWSGLQEHSPLLLFCLRLNKVIILFVYT